MQVHYKTHLVLKLLPIPVTNVVYAPGYDDN